MTNETNKCKVCQKEMCELRKLPKWLSVLSITFDNGFYCDEHFSRQYNLSLIFMIMFWFMNLSILIVYLFAR